MSISGYGVCCFNTGLLPLPSCCFFFSPPRADRQTVRQTEPGVSTSPAGISGWAPKRNTLHLLTFWEHFLICSSLWRNPWDHSRKCFYCLECNLAIFYLFFFANMQLLATILAPIFFFFMSKVKELSVLPAELLPVHYIWQHESSNYYLQIFTAAFDEFSPPSVFQVSLLLPAWLLATKDKVAKRRIVKLLQWFFFLLCFMYEKWMKVSPAYF